MSQSKPRPELSDIAKRLLAACTNTYIESNTPFIDDTGFYDVDGDDLLDAVTELQQLGVPITVSNHRPGRRYISMPQEYIAMQAARVMKARQQGEQ